MRLYRVKNEELMSHAIDWQNEIFNLVSLLREVDENDKQVNSFLINLLDGFNAFLYWKWPNKHSEEELKIIEEKGNFVKEYFQKKAKESELPGNSKYYKKMASITKETINYILNSQYKLQ